MDGGRLYSIGDLARRSGLRVRTIRFYADSGIVPPTDRDPSGYRRYDAEAAARLDLVRTLRDLGLDLATIRRVLDREVSLPEVAAAHAEALDVEIRVLRLRRAVLAAVAERGSTPEEMEIVHKLATLSEAERRRLVGDFLDAAFGDVAAESPGFVGVMRSLTPELPDNPEIAQVEAWVELAELAQDPDFRGSLRRMAQHQVADQGAPGVHRGPIAVVRDQVGPAVAAGIDPVSTEADPVVSAVTADYANSVGRPDDVVLRQWLLTRLETANDPRRQRYLELLAVINGWLAPEDLAPTLDWCVQALRARLTA
jgi:DNA-binding transcriptional MerR regulator